MRVFDVEILSHDEDTGVFTVSYCVDKGTGVIRRSVATYSGGHLSRDNDKPEITKEVERLLRYR